MNTYKYRSDGSIIDKSNNTVEWLAKQGKTDFYVL